MNAPDVARSRLNSQQLTRTNYKTIEETVRWMGAMQAQDFNMMKWAIGIRLPGTTEQIVENAISDAEIIRTHLMRPTWHVVSSADVYWILELTAPHVKSGMRSRHKQLELTDKVINSCKSSVANWLTDGNHLTRKEIAKKLFESKLVSANEQVTHVMVICELDQLVCSGRQKEKNPTYALLEERVQKPHPVTRDEALFKLADRYFRSHGPATLHDFIWWSGLPVRDARAALESVKPGLSLLKSKDQEFWFSDVETDSGRQESAHLLPAYDEFIISYKDRTASLSSNDHQKAISANGFFYPVVLANGRVAGIWKRTHVKNEIIVEISYFEGVRPPEKSVLEIATARYLSFLNPKIEFKNQESD